MSAFNDKEYEERLARLEAEVGHAGLDVYLVATFDNIYYLTGACFVPLDRPFFLLVYPGGVQPPTLLVPKLDVEHMGKAGGVSRIVSYWEQPAPPGRGWSDGLHGLLGSARRVGVEPGLHLELSGELADRELEVVPLVETLRLVKFPSEIDSIRRAAKYADFGVSQLLSAAFRGSTVAGGFARTRVVTRRILQEVHPWDPVTTSVLMGTWAAPGSARPHSIPELSGRLVDGPHVALVLTRVNGYAAECERTHFTERPTQEMKRAFAAMREARTKAFALLKPGTPCAEVDFAVREFLEREGYGGECCRLHRTGHGIGLGNHERPWIAEGSTDVLEENMIISIEPGIYLRGEGGYRHSDTVLITRDGYELLTNQPRELEQLTFTGRRPMARFREWLVQRALPRELRGRAARAENGE